MNFPDISGKIDREYDADSDGTYCSDAEMKLKSRAGEVEMLTLKEGESYVEIKIGSINQESENDFMKPTATQDFEQSQSCKSISKKSVRFQLERRKNFRNPNLAKKSSKSIKKIQLLEHHRVKMKNHGKILTNRLFAIRNDVKMQLGGYGLLINKKNAIALYEEVKAIKNILTQLYQASRRLTNYIGGDLPFTYKRYSSANQICETLLIQLNPVTCENRTLVSRELNKDGFISSNEDDADSEHGQSWNLKKKLKNRNKQYITLEGNRSNYSNENEICFKSPVFNCQPLGKGIATGQNLLTQEKNLITTTSQEHGTCGIMMNFTSSLTLNKNLTLPQSNQYSNPEKIQCMSLQNEYPESGQHSSVVSPKMSSVDIEIVDLCEDEVSPSPELINMEALKSPINQVDDLPAVPKDCISMEELESHDMIDLCEDVVPPSPEIINMEVLKLHINQLDDLPIVPKDCISKEESVSYDIALIDIHNAKESSEPKEIEGQCGSSQTQPISSNIQNYEINETFQARNSNQSNIKEQINKVLESSYFAFDEFPKEDATEIESSDNTNNPIDLQSVKIPCKESKFKETIQEETECSAFHNTVPKMKGMRSDNMDKTEDNRGNDELNAPSWCYIFEQHKIKNRLPTLIELMFAGMIQPGEKVLTIKDNDIKGSLLKDGRICTPEGATFQSPMVWCSAWSDGKSISKNLAYQRVYYKGVPLIEVCQKAFEIALEKLSAANLKKQSCHMTSELVLETDCSVTQLENAFTESYAAEEFEKKELLEDPIMAIEAVMVHSLEEFMVDEALECFFQEKGKFTGDLKFIDEW